MINFKQEVYNYIKNNIKSQNNAVPNVYALVQEDIESEEIPILFSLMPSNDGEWVLESPCSLITYGEAPTKEQFIYGDYKEYLDGCGNLGERKKYYDIMIAPMIVDNVWYDIDVPQVGPFLPTKVNKINFLTEHEMLLWLIEDAKKTKSIDIDEVINLFDRIKQENPEQVIIVDLPFGKGGNFKVKDCLFYLDGNNHIVFDAE